jgi:hypothetical protein
LGVIASDSQHANGGSLTADGCIKLKRHLDLCDLFHLPVLNLIDNPGFAVGLEHELAGTIRRGGEWMVAFAQVGIPIFSVLMRRSFGVAGNNYATPRSQPSMRVAWPAADVGGIPPEGGIEAAYKRQLAEAEDPVALRAELNARIESARGPLGPLSRFQIEEIIEEAFERCGLEVLGGYDLKTARRSLNLMFSEWANRGIHLWKIKLAKIPLIQGQAEYSFATDSVNFPNDLDEVLEAYYRNNSTPTAPVDVALTKIDRSAYSQTPNKLTQGTPSQYYAQRKLNPSIFLYAVMKDSLTDFLNGVGFVVRL